MMTEKEYTLGALDRLKLRIEDSLDGNNEGELKCCYQLLRILSDYIEET